MLDKVRRLKERYEELSNQIGSIELINNQEEWRKRVKEHSDLEEVVHAYDAHAKCMEELAEARVLFDEPDMRELAQAEIELKRDEAEKHENKIKMLLLPKDPNDDKNVVLEIRAGTGGEEAALFGADLMRMYLRYAERHNIKAEIMNLNETELGGVKDASLALTGMGVYSRLKFESGGHRVQRVPETESQGRIQTSAATIVVMPEVEDIEFEINPNDLKIDTYRAGGAGGQHVNKTESAIRITHLPTGLVVQCMDERSQHKNKDKAMRVLKTRLFDFYQSKQDAQVSATRKTLVGSGDRSERIRTYNFAQNRITDHRIGLTVYKLESFLDGDIDDMIDALLVADRAAMLESLSE